VIFRARASLALEPRDSSVREVETHSKKYISIIFQNPETELLRKEENKRSYDRGRIPD